jgi:hypothetical protein
MNAPSSAVRPTAHRCPNQLPRGSMHTLEEHRHLQDRLRDWCVAVPSVQIQI